MAMMQRTKPTKGEPGKNGSKPRPAKGKKNSKTTEPSWWEQAEEMPRAGLPDVKVLNKKARRWRLLVKATLIIAPLALLASFVAVASNLAASREEAPVVAVDDYIETRPTATIAVREWLSSVPSPIPGGVFLGWNDAERVEIEGVDGSFSIIDIHRYSVSSSNGTVYLATVPILVDGAVYRVMTSPSIETTVPAVYQSGNLWPDLRTVTIEPTLERAVFAWADAFTSGDPDALRFAIGDPDPENSYVPLVGAELVDIDIIAAGDVDPQAPGEDGSIPVPSTIIVNVQATIQWEGQPEPESGADLATVSYDLLIVRADTASPVVTAWAGPGMGPYLESFDNAVSGVEINTDAPLEEAPALPDDDVLADPRDTDGDGLDDTTGEPLSETSTDESSDEDAAAPVDDDGDGIDDITGEALGSPLDPDEGRGGRGGNRGDTSTEEDTQ